MSKIDEILLDLQLITVHYAPDTEENTLKALQLDALAEIKKLVESLDYDSKLSRKYFSANWNPQKAHKNGYRLAIRELNKLIGGEE